MYLLDTNVVSALRRPAAAPAGLVDWAKGMPVSDLFLSVMTVYELELGVQRMERRDPAQGGILRQWLDRGILGQFRDRILPIDEVVAACCASLHVPDPKQERDGFIGATALVHRLTLVTRNVRDFEGMGLEIIDPWT